MRIDKRTNVEEVVNTIKSGSTIAIGGVHYHNSPMIVIRELIRQNVTDLTLIGGFSLSIQIDMLIGAGLVKKVICPYVGFEGYFSPIAPNFRRAAEKNEIEIVELEEGAALYGLKAAAHGLPFHPFQSKVIDETDFPRKSPDIYKKVVSPFDNESYYVVPQIKPDIALLHSQYADQSGNAVYLGAGAVDTTMAEASSRVILTCDDLVPLEWIRQEYIKTHVIGHFITDLVHEWAPTHPCSSHGMYKHDNQHIILYLKHAREGKASFKRYLQKYVFDPKNQRSYVKLIGGKQQLGKLKIDGDY